MLLWSSSCVIYLFEHGAYFIRFPLSKEGGRGAFIFIFQGIKIGLTNIGQNLCQLIIFQNLKSACGHSLVSSLPFRNKFSVLSLKQWAKTYIKVFRYCLTLFISYFFPKYFAEDCRSKNGILSLLNSCKFDTLIINLILGWCLLRSSKNDSSFSLSWVQIKKTSI